MRVDRVKADVAPLRIAHARGDVRSEMTNAKSDAGLVNPGPPIIELAAATPAEIAKDGEDRKRWLKGRHGRRPAPVVEILLTGPPKYSDDNAWSLKEEKAWAATCVKWARFVMPGSIIEVASLHRDESSPHVHVMLRPAADGADGTRAWGMNPAMRQAVSVVTSKEFKTADSIKRWTRAQASKAMTMLQNSYYRNVGERFGLERGEIGSDRKHVAVSEIKALGNAKEAHDKHVEQERAKLDAYREELGETRKVLEVKAAAVEKDTDAVMKYRKALVAQDAEIERQRRLEKQAFERDKADKLATFDPEKGEMRATIMQQTKRIKELQEELKIAAPLANETVARRKAKRAADEAFEERLEEERKPAETRTREVARKRGERAREDGKPKRKPNKVVSLFQRGGLERKR